jgi:hypothetical protein
MQVFLSWDNYGDIKEVRQIALLTLIFIAGRSYDKTASSYSGKKFEF